MHFFTFTKQLLAIAFIYFLLVALTGCQLLTTENNQVHTEPKNTNYSQYYLLLAEFNEKQLATEVHYQQSILTKINNSNNSNTLNQQLKSVIYYSLPHSPVHNPFTAKSKLNQLSLEKLKAQQITVDDFAFFSMLKSQLNQQVLLLNKLTIEKKTQQGIKQAYQQQLLEFQQLQQQIFQLKKIEININEHGQ
jgi:hypothetical protein